METLFANLDFSSSCEANISEAVQSSDCEMLSKVDVPSAAMRHNQRCITDLEGGGNFWNTTQVEGETRMII